MTRLKSIIFKNISQLVTPVGFEAVRGSKMNDVLKITDAAMVISGDKIIAVGKSEEIQKKYSDIVDEQVDLGAKAVIPGFVDSHTHFVFGGYRPEEFMMRLKGKSYLEIHKAGGGIQNTVEATRKADFNELFETGLKRVKDEISMGVTTIESKSGYGLDRECELNQLKVINKIDGSCPIDVIPTYLGAHAIPTEYKGKSDEYIDYIINEMLPCIKAEHLAEYVDVFCEEGVFDIAQSEKLLLAAKKMGFGIKIHADEIVSLGGAELAGRLNATSADHLLMISDEGIKECSVSQTITTLLPCTAFCLDKPFAPARKLIDRGCAVALASDYNPGSCYTNSVPLMIALSVIHMNMSLEETITALTLNGAAAVGRQREIGSLERDKKADFVVLDCESIEYLVYHTCKNMVKLVYKGGKLIYESEE